MRRACLRPRRARCLATVLLACLCCSVALAATKASRAKPKRGAKQHSTSAVTAQQPGLDLLEPRLSAFFAYEYQPTPQVAGIMAFEKAKFDGLKGLMADYLKVISRNKDPEIKQAAYYKIGAALESYAASLKRLPVKEAVQALEGSPQQKKLLEQSFLKKHADNRAATRAQAAYFYKRAIEQARRSQQLTRWTLEAMLALHKLEPGNRALPELLKARSEERNKVSVLVMDLRPERVDPALARIATGLVTQEVDTWKRSNVTVLELADVRDMLDHEANKQLLGCTTDSCLSEVTAAVGAHMLITGSVIRTAGDSYVLSLNLIQVSPFKVERREKQEFVSEELLPIFVTTSTQKLIEDILDD